MTKINPLEFNAPNRLLMTLEDGDQLIVATQHMDGAGVRLVPPASGRLAANVVVTTPYIGHDKHHSLTLYYTSNAQAELTNLAAQYAEHVPPKGNRPGWFYSVHKLRAVWFCGPGSQLEFVALDIDEPRPGTPVAHIAGKNGTIPVGEQLVLDGSKSSDPDGDKLSYSWKITEQPKGSTVAPSVTDGAELRFTPTHVGPYTVELSVSDGSHESPAEVVHYQAEIVNRPPEVTVHAGREIVVGESIVASAALIASDPDNDALSRTWTLTGPQGSKATLDDPSGETPSFTPDLPGNYTVKLEVTDKGKLSASGSATWVAIKADTPPVAVIAKRSEKLATGAVVTLDGSKSHDDDDDDLTYAWQLVTKPKGSHASLDGAAGPKASFTPDVDGDYTIALRVTAGGAASKEVEVTYTAKTPNHRPSANAGGNGKGYCGIPVTLHGSGSDPDADTDLSYEWTLEAPPDSIAKLDDATSEQPTFTPDLVGLYKLSLVVSDGDAKSPAATAIWEVGASTIPNANNVDIVIGAEGDAKSEYVEIVNTGSTTLRLAGVVIEVPTAPANASHSSFEFGDTRYLEPGAKVRVAVGPVDPPALSFGSARALFDAGTDSTVELHKGDLLLASKTLAGASVTGPAAFAKLELDFYRTGGSLQEYVRLSNPSAKTIDLRGLRLEVPSASNKAKAQDKHEFEFADGSIAPKGEVIIRVAGPGYSFDNPLPLFYSESIKRDDTVELWCKDQLVKRRTKSHAETDQLQPLP